MELADFWGLLGLPFVMALVEVFKGFIVDKRWYPVVAICLGMAVNTGIATQTGANPLLAVLTGAVVGLAASGLYSSGKTLAGK